MNHFALRLTRRLLAVTQGWPPATASYRFRFPNASYCPSVNRTLDLLNSDTLVPKKLYGFQIIQFKGKIYWKSYFLFSVLLVLADQNRHPQGFLLQNVELPGNANIKTNINF